MRKLECETRWDVLNGLRNVFVLRTEWMIWEIDKWISYSVLAIKKNHKPLLTCFFGSHWCLSQGKCGFLYCLCSAYLSVRYYITKRKCPSVFTVERNIPFFLCVFAFDIFRRVFLLWEWQNGSTCLHFLYVKFVGLRTLLFFFSFLLCSTCAYLLRESLMSKASSPHRFSHETDQNI